MKRIDILDPIGIRYLWKNIKTLVSTKVGKVSSSTDNAVVRFDGTSGNIQNSGVTIDDSNNVSTSGNVSGKDIIVHGTYASDNYRKISSGAANNMYVQLDSSSNAYTTWNTTEFRRGANVTNYNLGSSTYPWNNAYAKKWITDGGTAYDYVMGDGSLKDRYFQTLNTFSNGDSSKLYIEPVMDCMYAAHLKWNVSATITNTTTEAVTNVTAGQIAGWFNGDYGRVGQYVDANETLKITIQTSDPENSYMTTYSEGRLLLNFYNYGLPLSVSGRCYYGSTSKAWANLTFTTQRGGRNGIYISNTLPTPYLRIIELTIVGQKVSGDPNKTNLSSIEMMRTRCGIGDYPIVTKYGIAQRMYGNLTAPKFITSGGTSSQFVKGDGSLDSTTYAHLASPALTGTPTAPTAASGTNTTQIATTAFVHEELINISTIPYNQGSIIFSDAPFLYNEKTFSANFPITDALGSNSPFVKCYGPVSSYKDWDSDYIPVIPGTELEGEVWAYRASNATGTAGALYVGILRYDKNKKPIAANLGVTYFIANNMTVPSDGVWHQYTGTTTIPTTHTVYNGSTGEGCYYIRVRVFVNLSAGTIPTYICGLKIKNNELASQLGDIETLLASI